jgi:hypothetical protein
MVAHLRLQVVAPARRSSAGPAAWDRDHRRSGPRRLRTPSTVVFEAGLAGGAIRDTNDMVEHPQRDGQPGRECGLPF